MDNSFFNEVLDDNEEILWSEKPSFVPFIIQCWSRMLMSVVFFFVFLPHLQEQLQADGDTKFILYSFIIIFTFAGPFDLLRLILSYFNTQYALTNKRILIRGGFFGVDFKSIDHDKISEIIIDVNPIEKLLRVGTIKAFSGRISEKSSRQYDSIIGIEQPYETFKIFKTTNTDIKTDISYPNALRPEENPGYNTKYKKKN